MKCCGRKAIAHWDKGCFRVEKEEWTFRKKKNKVANEYSQVWMEYANKHELNDKMVTCVCLWKAR